MSRATWAGENDPAKAIVLPSLTTVDDAQPGSAATQEPPAVVTAEPPAGVDGGDKTDDTNAPLKPSRQPPKRTSGRDKAAAIIKRNPGLTDAEVAKRAGVSVRTVQRARP
jgi:hypothetical protein